MMNTDKLYEKVMRQEAFDLRNFGSSEMRESYHAFDVQQKQEEVGQLLFAEAKEDDSTRLFIKRLSIVHDVVCKDGWWDMFTVASKSCKKGIYICRIDVIRLDRNKFPMMEVTPISYLGESIDEESVAWDYFSRSNLFSKYYTESHYKNRFNVNEVETRFENLWKPFLTAERTAEMEKQYVPEYARPATLLFEAFCDGKVTLKEIEEALDTPEGFEAMAIDIAKNPKKYDELYPLMMGKIRSLDSGYVTINKIQDYLFSRYYSASDMQREGKISKEIEGTFELIEASICYYVAQKEAEKAARKAARKAKKAQKACS